MKKTIMSITLMLAISLSLISQQLPLTVAEKSDYKSTSTYAEVIAFIKDLNASPSQMKIEYFATTTYGKELPLLIIADPMPQGPADLKNDNRVVVYIQANIHAGEVEGKEGSLMLVRDLLNTKYASILKDVVVLVVPILNADGNDQISKANRTNQNGPENGVGVRHNGQYLDMNRDAMKLETPELNGVVQNILNRWDPSVMVDCHTTNGSYYEEPVTFGWVMSPNGDLKIRNFMRDVMMPDVQNRLKNDYKTDNCFYGNFIDNRNPDKGWIFDAASARYMTNYIGVRSRMAILNENYVHADYKARVLGSYNLLKSILDYSAKNKTLINKQISDADERTIAKGNNPDKDSKFAIEYKPTPTPKDVTIKSYTVEEYKDENGRTRYRPTDIKKTVTVPYLAEYIATKEVNTPYAYVLLHPDVKVLNNLKAHGIKVEKLNKTTKLEVERFKINEIIGGPNLNQGHYNTLLKGEFVTDNLDFEAGTYIVRTGQKLGNLVAYLLEPESDDGLLYWNYFDKYLAPQWGRNYFPYPVFKVMKKTELPTIKI
ncbi:MAG: M14 family metallopeptidase [Bacteroidetes bacterium]|nr:M14 family metallopeptidase [Bacteroidota bacterium]